MGKGKIQDSAIVSLEHYSNSYVFYQISNNLEQILTLFSRSRHTLTLNISQTATDTTIVTIEDE